MFKCFIIYCHLSAILCSDFLKHTANQLTYHGLCTLNATITEQQLCVFFRNNHFSTLYKHQVVWVVCVHVCIRACVCSCMCVCVRARAYMCVKYLILEQDYLHLLVHVSHFKSVLK